MMSSPDLYPPKSQ